MKVCFLFRKPRPGDYSIEVSFNSAIQSLPAEIKSERAVARFHSNGLFKRLYNIIEAAFRDGDVYHVTGDIHYITYLLRKRKTILTIHDCGFLLSQSRAKAYFYRLFWIRIPVQRVKFVTVVSESTKRELLKISPDIENKLRVVPSCVSPAFVAKKKTFSAEKPRILQIGTGQNKNLPRLAEALHGLNCHLTVVGKLNEDQIAGLQTWDIEYDTLYDLDIDSLVRAYQESDIVAFVSLYEGFGMPIVEANVIGRPVITSNTCSMPEVAGDAACLVDPLDVKAIREGLEKIIFDEDYRETLIQNGFRNALRFRAQVATDLYANLYKEITD